MVKMELTRDEKILLILYLELYNKAYDLVNNDYSETNDQMLKRHDEMLKGMYLYKNAGVNPLNLDFSEDKIINSNKLKELLFNMDKRFERNNDIIRDFYERYRSSNIFAPVPDQHTHMIEPKKSTFQPKFTEYSARERYLRALTMYPQMKDKIPDPTKIPLEDTIVTLPTKSLAYNTLNLASLASSST